MKLTLNNSVTFNARITTQSAPPSGVQDEFFSSVVLLLDFAGSDGATNITDLSNSAHVETFINESEVDTDEQILGENSLKLDGTGASNEASNADLIRYDTNVDWQLGANDFTIEFHFRQNTGALSDFIFISTRADAAGDTGTGGWGVDSIRAAIDDLRIVNQSDIIAQSTVNFIPVDDTWYHLAYTRTGTDIRFFVDGVQLGATIDDDPATDLDDSTSNPLRIGAFNNDRFGINGNMANIRITKGVGRYTSNFTPPTEFYPTS